MNNKKSDFSIEGSEALKKAFVEECGIPPLTDKSHLKNYLTSTRDKKNLQSSTDRRKDKHFILPSQWEEALQYVKEYFAEEEFKAGDKVIVVSDKTYNWDKSVGSRKPIIGEMYVIVDAPYTREYVRLDGNNSNKIAIKSSDLRKATPEEIKALETKSFNLGEYKATVTKDKVEIADRGSVTIPECIEWFEKEFVCKCNDTYLPLGEFTVVENTYTIDIGCVKNVPLKDIEVLYKYLKTL